jgi:hypothetical protein
MTESSGDELDQQRRSQATDVRRRTDNEKEEEPLTHRRGGQRREEWQRHFTSASRRGSCWKLPATVGVEGGPSEHPVPLVIVLAAA